jgi:hypothetical protein
MLPTCRGIEGLWWNAYQLKYSFYQTRLCIKASRLTLTFAACLAQILVGGVLGGVNGVLWFHLTAGLCVYAFIFLCVCVCAGVHACMFTFFTHALTLSHNQSAHMETIEAMDRMMATNSSISGILCVVLIAGALVVGSIERKFGKFFPKK